MIVLADLLIGAPSWIPVAIGAVVVCGVLTVLGYRGVWMSPGAKFVACCLKIVGVMLLASCLIEPLFSGVRPRPGANLFVVLTDNSQSMTVASGSAVRGDTLKELLADNRPWRTRLEQDFDVRDYMFDNQVKHVGAAEEITFDGTASALHTALRTLRGRFEQRPVAGVLLLTDGNATDLRTSETFPFPIYPVVDEDSSAVNDVRIRAMNVTQTNFEASPITVNAAIASQGFAGEELTARIVSQAGIVLKEQTQRVEGSQELEFRFRFRPEESGLSFHRLEVFPTRLQASFEQQEVDGELTLANNVRWFTVKRGGGPFRILYVAGRPNWEFKFLKRGLEEDDEIALSGLLRIAKKQPKFVFQDTSGLDRNQLFEGFDGKDDEDAETYDQTVFIRVGAVEPGQLVDGFPKDAAELFAYHAVILDDIEAKFFSANQMLLLRRFVSQRGGGLLMLGGQESFVEGGYDKTPLGEVLPVYLKQRRKTPADAYRWELTREGWLQDWTRLRTEELIERQRLRDVPSVSTVNHVSGLKPGASLLASLTPEEGSGVPALVTQRFGKGRSSAVLVGALWRWQMHHEDPKQQDLQQFWRQVVRYMVADVPMRVAVEAERLRGASGPASISVTVLDEDFQPHDNAEVNVTVTSPGGETMELTAEPSMTDAGQYVVDFWPRENGPYRAAAEVTTADGEMLDRKETGWTSQPAAEEFRELTTNQEALEELAKQSGGELIRSGDLETFVAGLPNRKVPVTETWVYPIWHQAWVLVLAVVCLCGEWGLRRMRGLP